MSDRLLSPHLINDNIDYITMNNLLSKNLLLSLLCE